MRRADGPQRHRAFWILAPAALLPLLVFAATPVRKEAADLLIVHSRVVTMDQSLLVFDDGGIAVRGGMIIAVGPSAGVLGHYSARSTYDGRGKIVMPGLVNTHTHAAMTLLRGLADDRSLEDWLTHFIFPAEAKNVSPEFVRAGTRLACLEMIEGGTTTFADMYYFESDAAEEVSRAGMRAVLGETWIDLPAPGHKDLAEAKAYTRAFIERWSGDALVTPAIAPHAPYTCSKETLLAAKEMAVARRVPLLIHVAETKKEWTEAKEKWGASPVAHLNAIGFFGSVPLVAAHGVWIDASDRQILKKAGVSLSHNPESNMKLASGIADVSSWQTEELTWGLGTDGPAGSNNDLSMFEAMDFAGKLAKVSREDPTVLPASEIVAAATRGGARALGFSEKIGSLEAGKQADFIAIDTANAHVQPFEDAGGSGVSPDRIYSALVYSVKASDVTDVWVNGKQLLAHRRPTTLDQRVILLEARRWREKIRRSLM